MTRSHLLLMSLVLALLATGVLLAMGLLPGQGRDQSPAGGGQAGVPAVEPTAPVEDRVADAGGEPRLLIRLRQRGELGESASLPSPALLMEAGRRVDCQVDVVAGPDRRGPDRSGAHLLRFGFGDGSGWWRLVTLGEEPAVVERFAPLILSGRVVDNGGAGVVGASIWVGETSADGRPVLWHSGEDGRFEIAGLQASRGVPLVVRAEGHASQWQHFDLLQAQARPRLVQLGEAAELKLVLAASTERPDLGRLLLSPLSQDLETRHYPFFWSALDVEGWSFDRDGRLTMSDLPRGGRLAMDVVHPELVSAPPAEVDLRRPRQSAIVPALVGLRVTGRALDGSGLPLGDTELWLAGDTEPRQRPGAMLPLLSGRALRTDVEGRFAFGVAPDRSSRVELIAPGCAPLKFELEGATDLGELSFVAPPIGSVGPAIRITLPQGGDWDIRLDGPGELRRPAEDAVEIALPRPMLLDVDLRLRDAQGRRERSWQGLSVLGLRTLSLDS